MTLRVLAVTTAAAMGLLLSSCTTQLSDGHTAKESDTLRPGTPPMGVGREPGGPPVDASTQIFDANAPKESNGGTGTEPSVLHGGLTEAAATSSANPAAGAVPSK